MTLNRLVRIESPWGITGFLHGRVQLILERNPYTERNHGTTEHI